MVELLKIFEHERPVALILCGLPGSGKSTFIDRNLKGKADFVLISSDAYIEEKALEEGTTYSDVFQKYIGTATANMKSEFRKAVEEGKNIVWDQTNLSSKKRKSILDGLSDRYLKVAVVFNVEDKELQRRLDNRAKENGKLIPEHVMDKMLKSFRPVTKEEGFAAIIEVR